MGAGASSDQEKKSVQRTIVSAATPNSKAAAGGGFTSPPRAHGHDDIALFTSPMQLDKKAKGAKWQIEEEMGRWADLAPVAAERVEAGFQEGKATVTVTLNNRIATADLGRYSLTFGGGASSSPNASVSSPLGSSGGKRIRRVDAKGAHGALVDPFALDDVSPAVPIIDGGGEDNGMFSVELQSVIYAHDAPAFCCGFSMDGQSILSSAKDGTMKYWEVASSFLRQQYEPVNGAILCAALCHGGSKALVASGSDDFNVRVYDVDNPSPKVVLSGHTHKVYGIDFTRDGRTIVSTSMDKTIRTWDVNTLKEIRAVKCHESSIFSQRVSPLSPWLVLTASDDSTLAAHDLRMPSASYTVRRYMGHTKTLWGCDIRFDEMQYISCGTDNTVMLWDPRQEREPIKTITSHQNPVHCVEYLPEGTHFLSSSRDRSIKITDANSGVTCLSTQAHDGHVYRVAFNAATDRLMSCGADCKVKVWSLKRKF